MGRIPWWIFFYKIGRVEGLPGPYPHAKLHACDIKNLGYRRRNRQNWQFFEKIVPKGYIPFSDFYKIWRGEGVLGSHPHANFNRCGF